MPYTMKARVPAWMERRASSPTVIRTILMFVVFLSLEAGYRATYAQASTYCNPMNLDYAYCPIPDFTQEGKHRATADPVISAFEGRYYLFSTNQWGYWFSEDMVDWNFVARKFLKPWHHVYDELCAPAVFSLGDTLFVIGSTHTKDFPIWMSTDPVHDTWTEAISAFQVGAWDPAFFEDGDGRLYCYWGSSNFYPIYGQEIDRKTFVPVGTPKPLIHLADSVHGWERFGEHNDNTFLDPFMEGAWMNKHAGRYYLQYAAPGTEFSGYADGVYVGDAPLGPFTYQPHNPFSYKPGGFARGAGHGATFQDLKGHWWHVATIVISVKNNFERRLGLWPAGFDDDGVLYCNTAFGDYPHYLSDQGEGIGKFTGWMLLNYNKHVAVSSALAGHPANFAVDEDIRTWWSAATGNAGEWIETDLGAPCTIHAIQINYADQDAGFMGKQSGIFHQYRILESMDGKKWTVLIDKSKNTRDVPHDYAELAKPVETRYLRLENIHMPTGKFALSGFRVFGKGSGAIPDSVGHFTVLRGDRERRNAWIKWQLSDDATGYVISAGTQPDKLYTSMMVYGKNEYYFDGMNAADAYYFQIQAFNENGSGPPTAVVKAP